MSEYDVYLNSVGFMLARDAAGGVLSGAARDTTVDPFTRHLSADEPYVRVPFRIGDGAGITDYDGSNRYEWGHAVDSRSGKLVMAPQRDTTTLSYSPAGYKHHAKVTTESALNDVRIEARLSYTDGIAQRFVTPPGATTIRSVALLVRRRAEADVSWADSAPFYVAIAEDDTGPKPKDPVIGYVAQSLKYEGGLLHFADRWRNGDWFWLSFVFDTDLVVGEETAFWVQVTTNDANNIEWLYLAEDTAATYSATRSVRYHEGAFENGTSAKPLMIKVGYKDSPYQTDSFPLCFQMFRGEDEIERVYAGTAYRVLCWDPTWGDGHWWEDKTIGQPVMQLTPFNFKLFAACGTGTDMWWSDGGGEGALDWTQITGQKASALAVHDGMLWKAHGANVKGSEDGTTWTAGSVQVGDPGSICYRGLVSHGGKLLAAKPEGIFEISYPDTYPDTGDPTCNLMLDFSTEKCYRTWILDWHSGLYFPGLGGVYELKNGVLRNLWEEKVDENAQEPRYKWAPGTPIGGATKFVTPRSWAPLYDKGPVTWTAAIGTTRGIMFARSNPHINTSDLIWYDGRNWYNMRAAGGTNTDGSPQHLGEYITALCVQDVGGGRGWLWFNEGFDLCRQEWPTWTDDTQDDENVTYPRYGQFTTPWFSLPEHSKEILLCKLGMTSSGLDSNHKASVYYRLDDSLAWISLGVFNTSPYQELTFGSGTTAHSIQFQCRLDNYYDDNSTTLALSQMDLFYQNLPETTRTHQLIIDCGSEALREGGVDERSPAEVLTDLKELVGNTNFTYLDPLGLSHTVRVMSITSQVMNITTGPGPGAHGSEVQAIVTMLEL